nr:uncharacterized protein LOC107279151 [Oryza sativa Japonica Group]
MQWFGGNANPCRRCSGARTGRRHWDIVFVAVEPEQAEPSHRTINISSVSSLKSLMNPCQWCSELGDRHCLPQFRLSSSTFDFSLSDHQPYQAGVVIARGSPPSPSRSARGHRYLDLAKFHWTLDDCLNGEKVI